MNDLKSRAHQQARARQRAQLIMQVRSGVLSAQQAARQLGVSRKTYYKWEQRALAALVEALGDREQGRPPRPVDPEKEALQRQTLELQAKLEVLEQTERIRQQLQQLDKKKAEAVAMMVTSLNRLKQQVHRPYRHLCASVGLSYASFRRWKYRLEQGQPLLFKPGPHKLGPLRLAELRVDLCQLKHARQRSHGIGRLYRQYQDQISRRDLQALTRAVRQELTQQRQRELQYIRWQVPGLVWSLDNAELASFAPQKLYLHQVQDLASRYKFTPWVGEQILGETVAVHLEQLFLRHGPPLVLKRDNGSNLNQPAVEEVLGRYGVIPLNSPPYYPPYNGGMECAVRELKTPLVQKILDHGSALPPQVQAWAEVLAHELNPRSRACLHGQVACRVFQDAKPALKAYTLRKRREIFDWINGLTQTRMEVSAVQTPRQAATARRLAVETWLQTNGVISITHNSKVLPIFPEKTAHN